MALGGVICSLQVKYHIDIYNEFASYKWFLVANLHNK